MPYATDYRALGSSSPPKRSFTSGRPLWLMLAGLLSAALLLASPGGPSLRSLTSAITGTDYADLSARNVAVTEREVAAAEPLQSNNRTQQVQWDNYSLFLNGQRIFLHSGEFHTFRLPVPSLWPDILQKVKAAGLNAISVYTHMGLINPAPGVVDFGGYRALQPLYEAATEAGIWIVLRPGPYINAETTAGGLAHWITSEVAGVLRTNATDFYAAWQAYVQGIITETVPYQITNGGPVIAIQVDNEYSQTYIPGAAGYFAELEAAYHNSSIVVPLTYNDPGEGKNFVNGTGAVDIYGLDSYPQSFDCSNPTVWDSVVTNYYDYHMGTNPSQPFYIPEFQGGAFDPWGPSAPGYENCRILTGADFESVFYHTLWAANVKLINYYMIFGGTSWGAIPFHGVYTSYDYGSSITENRTLTDKYSELKRQALFLRSSPEFYKTDWIGNSSTSAVSITNPAAFVVKLQNPDTSAGFYIARQLNSSSLATTSFQLAVTTSAGSLELPQVVSNITLTGRQSKVIVTDYTFGSSKVLYSTASVLFAGTIGGRDVLFLYGDSTQQHEASLALTGIPQWTATDACVGYKTSGGQTIVSFLSGINGLVTVWDSTTQLVLFADTYTAGTFWNPVIPAASGEFANYWQFGTNTSVLVGGPYLVRNASISGTTLDLYGDLETGVRLTVIAPPSVKCVTWNGFTVEPDYNAVSSLTYSGGFVSELQPAVAPISVPALTGWKYADSLPEVQTSFSDASWTLANHTTTNIPYPMYYGDGRVLYGCDYGYCENIVLWRGHFNATGSEKSVNLSINGGEAFAASVWLNNQFLNTSYGNSSNNRHILEETDDVFYFPPGSVIAGQDNAITIVQDNMGLNETDGGLPNTSKSPRGVRGFKLNTGTFSEWKVQGGTYGERQGWHLPGYDTSSWTSRELSAGLPNSAAGVGFFVTTFDLDTPQGFDIMMSFTFDNTSQPYRAYLFVNGWMMGKRVSNLGPEYKFPVHEGILDYHGTNTVAVALWSMENVAISPSLELAVDAVFTGGVGGVVTDNPGWTSVGRV
ncbi:glycoside hydrolase family 35 protein [Jaapia argillacea MUCL 33604]|uniref:beta-galactosidase n=1 Tax=Jaapia argillacea MUCL 33604 TaxID=933084 RepID=A0A067P6I7_9AGAM|nr:glycoside hydrolase family 35 protein [Jaapia argillacea MUCL 33604]